MPVEPGAVTCSAKSWSVQRRIGEIDVRLRSELKQVCRDFARIYPAAEPGGPHAMRPSLNRQNNPDDAIIEIEIRKRGWNRFGRRLYQVSADGTEVGGVRTANGVFPLVEWGINLRILATRTKFLQIHAASMVYRNQGFIFAADSGSGKSTLAAILLARRWQYLCDEFALIDPASCALHPFPKALCIKAGSYSVVRRLGLRFARRRDYVKAFKGRVGYVDPRQLGSHAIGAVAPVRFVVFPSYQRGATPKLHPMERGRAALALSRCCFNAPAHREGTVSIMTKLLARARCFRLEVGEPGPTAKLLESQLGSIAAPTIPARDVGAALHTPEPHASAWAASRNMGASRSIETPRGLKRAAQDSEGGNARNTIRPSRREVLRLGARLSYTAPLLLTLSANEALAATSNPSGLCSTALNSGDLCEVDSDCCSEVCSLGVCQ